MSRTPSHRLHPVTRLVALSLAMMTTACEGPQRLSAPAGDLASVQVQADLVRDPIDLPFYARVERPYIAPHTKQRAAIVFYRPPVCVDDAFNLLDFFDIPGAFFCGSHTVGGFTYSVPNAAPPPWLQLTEGSNVPIWFVRWRELEAAVSDDVLTMPELRALPSLVKGTARKFRERLEPCPTRNPCQTKIHAEGVLADGRIFVLDHLEVNFAIVSERIEFGRRR